MVGLVISQNVVLYLLIFQLNPIITEQKLLFSRIMCDSLLCNLLCVLGTDLSDAMMDDEEAQIYIDTQ